MAFMTFLPTDGESAGEAEAAAGLGEAMCCGCGGEWGFQCIHLMAVVKWMKVGRPYGEARALRGDMVHAVASTRAQSILRHSKSRQEGVGQGKRGVLKLAGYGG